MKTMIFIFLIILGILMQTNPLETVYETQPGSITDSLYEKGEVLFMENCKACHHEGMKLKSTAPPLGGVTKRFKKEWLYAFTRNSYQMYLDRDPKARRLLRRNNMSVMTPFPEMKDAELDAIYYFIEKRNKENKK